MPVKVILNFIVGNCDGNYRYQYFRFPWRLCKSSEIKRKSFLTRFPCTTQYQHELVPFGHIDALIGNQLGWHCVSFADREQCECLASGNHHFCCPMRHYVHKHWKLPSHPQPPISMMTSGPRPLPVYHAPSLSLLPSSPSCLCLCIRLLSSMCVQRYYLLILFTTTSKTASSS